MKIASNRCTNIFLLIVLVVVLTILQMICLAGCGYNRELSKDTIDENITYEVPDGWEEVDTDDEGVHLIMKDINEFPYIAIFVDEEISNNTTQYKNFTDFEDNVSWITDAEKQFVSKRRECSKTEIDGNETYLAYEEYTENNNSKLKYYWDYEIEKDGVSITMSMETTSKADASVFEDFVSSIEFNDK